METVTYRGYELRPQEPPGKQHGGGKVATTWTIPNPDGTASRLNGTPFASADEGKAWIDRKLAEKRIPVRE